MRQICGHLLLVKIVALGNSLFGDVKLTANTHPDKYEYSGYVFDLM